MALTPVALPPALPSELLTFVLTHQSYPTTLIICQPRPAFLSSLLETINHTSRPQLGGKHNQDDDKIPTVSDEPEVPPDEPPECHPLLIPTLHQVARSRHINLVFVPTISHLRAYLAVFPPPLDKDGPPQQIFDKPGKKVPLLLIYGLVALHRDTSEWSAQGLGESLSGLVEAGRRAGRRVVSVEQQVMDDIDVDLVEESREDWETRRNKSLEIWEERLPILNGSTRRAGLESEDGAWVGRTVEVGRILGRWFMFRKGDWVTNENASSVS